MHERPVSRRRNAAGPSGPLDPGARGRARAEQSQVLTHRRVLDRQEAVSLNALAGGGTGANVILAQSWGLV